MFHFSPTHSVVQTSNQHENNQEYEKQNSTQEQKDIKGVVGVPGHLK